MNKKLSVFLLVLTIVFMFAMTSSVFADEPLKAETTFGTAVIDGKGDDWANVPEYPINKFKEGTKKDENFKAYYKTKFDGKHLYVFIYVQDKTVSKKPGGVVNNPQDRVTTYIDYSNAGQGNYNDPYLKQYQVTVNRYGDWGQYDCTPYDLNNNIECKVDNSSDSYYAIEYKLNLEGITGEKVTADKVIGFDIQVSDMNSSGSDRLGAYGWNDQYNRAWNDASALGKLTLKVKAQEEKTPKPSGNTTSSPANTPNNETNSPETNSPDPTESATPDGTASATPDGTTSATPDSTSTATPDVKPKDGNFPWLVLVIVLVVLAGGAAAVYFFVIRKKDL